MKKFPIVAVKVCVSAGLITWLIMRANLSEVMTVLARANWAILVPAFFLFFVGYSVTAARWSILQRSLGGSIRYWFLVKSFMVAMFFNNFLPSTMGGDAIRMYDTYRAGSSKTVAVAAVLMDRIVGVTALLIFAMVGLYFGEYAGFGEFGFVTGVMIAAGCALLGLVFLVFMPWSLVDYLESLVQRLPKLVSGFGNSLIFAIRAFRKHRLSLLAAFVLSLVLQSIVVFYHWLVGLALGLDVALMAYFLIVPIAIIMMMLPISINGIGVREGLFVLLLGSQGVTESEGLAYAWILYGAILLQGVCGGIVFALRAEADRPKPPTTMGNDMLTESSE